MALHHVPPPAPLGPIVTDLPSAPGSVRQRQAPRDWRVELPVITGSAMTLRELRASDAPTLFAMLTSEEASRFVSAPPPSVEGVERFIEWTVRERAAGTHACFGIVPHGMTDAVGIIQIRQTEADFRTAEWGFALGVGYWGSGVFAEAAPLALRFAFEVLGVHRLEARAAVKNGRGNGALRKLGAVAEGILRRSFYRHGEYLDQVLWTILATDRARPEGAALVH